MERNAERSESGRRNSLSLSNSEQTRATLLGLQEPRKPRFGGIPARLENISVALNTKINT
jgi:hypothetical protein